jgi:membrane protein DedA with SNARE-associated domain
MSLASLSQHLVDRYGPLGLLLGMTAESAGIPLPSEVIMPLGGLLSPNVPALLGVIALGTGGNLLGSWIAYAIGAGIRSRLVPSAPGAPSPAAHGHLAAAYAWWARRGGVAVLLGRVLPGVRTYISFPAGAAAMAPLRFSAYTLLGSAVWSSALAVAGYVLRRRWRLIVPWFDRYTAVVLGVLVVAVALSLLWAWRRRRTLPRR